MRAHSSLRKPEFATTSTKCASADSAKPESIECVRGARNRIRRGNERSTKCRGPNVRYCRVDGRHLEEYAMHVWPQITGLGLCLGGAVLIALADAWLSRSFLIYLDAIEASVGKIVDAFQSGNTQIAVPFIDFKRDRGQNRARALKTIGWLALAMGFGLQMTASSIASR
jgi:hypothetical protein